MDPSRVSTHSMRAGCATALYANGVDPIDIQRWGRWTSPVYMRYVWHGDVKLHTLSYALTRKTNLIDHLLAPKQKKRATFKDDCRCGGKSGKPLSGVEPETPFDTSMSEFGLEMMEIVEAQRQEDQKKGKPRVSPMGGKTEAGDTTFGVSSRHLHMAK